MKKGSWHSMTAEILIVIGALVWLFYGAFKFNIVEFLLGFGFIARAIYILVGVSAIYFIIRKFMKRR